MPAVSTDHARWMTLTQIDDRLRQLCMEPKPRSDVWRRRVDQLLEARTKVTK
jgi:predicted secreted protein